jgi:hypothetical protein
MIVQHTRKRREEVEREQDVDRLFATDSMDKLFQPDDEGVELTMPNEQHIFDQLCDELFNSESSNMSWLSDSPEPVPQNFSSKPATACAPPSVAILATVARPSTVPSLARSEDRQAIGPKHAAVGKRNSTSNKGRVGRLGLVWTLLTLLAVGFCGFVGLKDIGRTTKPISQIELGDRTTGRNLLREQVDTDTPDPDPATWKQLDFRLQKPSGKCVRFSLLWPPEWIEASGAKVGGTIHMDMPEFGAVGQAEVLAIGPCPPIKSGNGNVVTGKFIHEPEEDLLNIWIEGAGDPIGSTPNHLIWSEDRLD